MSHNQVLDDSPWLAPGAILAMETYLAGKSVVSVFEWGAGGSTLWFARRAGNVISIEHDLKWLSAVAVELQRHTLKNVALTFIPETGPYPEYIIQFHAGFDLILVDGILRNWCITSAIHYLRSGDWLVLDNTERQTEYAEAISLLKDWGRHDYQGDGFTTSIFIKP